MKKMFNVTYYWGNANQNHNERSPHSYQDGYFKKQKQKISIGENVEKLEPFEKLT